MKGQNNETYIVEKIVDKKIKNGKPLYLVKWQGWPSETNTWEPRAHLAECEDLIEEFESRKTPSKRGSKGFLKRSSKGTTPNGNASLNTSSSKSKSKNVAGVELDDIENESNLNGSRGQKSKKRNSEKVGFSRGLTPQEIVGAVENDGIYCFLIKWEGSEETDIVPASEAHKFCPQLVIQFYEKRIMWKPVTK